MRITIMLTAAAALAAMTIGHPAAAATASLPHAATFQADELSAAKRKRARAYRAQPQVACTRFGCRPIPPGCRIVTEYNPWTWNPSGFDAVVCRRR